MSLGRSLFGLCLLLSVACVDARAKPALGNTDFAAGVSLSSADYAQTAPAAPARGTLAGSGAAAANVGPAAPTAPLGAAGASALPPPPPAAMPGENPSVPPPAGVAGRGMAAMAGRPAANGGAAGMAPPGAAGMPAPAAGTGAVAPSGGGKLTADFKTVALGGQYAPRNVGAVWIETSSGMFVKTLERWAGIRSVHLTRWTMASGGWGSIFGGGNTADMMDAVSRATLRSHEMHHVMWDMQDASGKPVADGKYNLWIEVADDNFRASTSNSVAFDKGPAPASVMAPDKAPFASLSITFQP